MTGREMTTKLFCDKRIDIFLYTFDEFLQIVGHTKKPGETRLIMIIKEGKTPSFQRIN